MRITIGQKTGSSFSDPLGLLGDCHRAILRDLQKIYQRHIAVEDTDVFPLARKVLEPSEIE